MRSTQFLASLALLITVVACSSAPPTSPTPGPTEALGPVTDADIDAWVGPLAASGVAVYADESATTPTAAPADGEVFAVTRWQLANMVGEIQTDAGMLGSDLDAALAMPEGGPSFSYLLAAWIDTSQSPAAAMVRDAMGPHDWTVAPDQGFPTMALMLFVAETAVAANAVEVATLVGVARPAMAPPIPVTAALDHPCSLVTGFVDRVLSTVFNALKINAGQFGDGVPGRVLGFLSGIWNRAVDLARGAVEIVLGALTGPIVAAIRTVAGIAATIAVVASYLKPWLINVNASPSTPHFTVEGSATVSGSYTLEADVRVANFPPAVQDCASAVGIQPPELTAVGAPVTWQITGHPELVIVDQAGPPYSGTLGADHHSTLSYHTPTEPADWHASGPFLSGPAVGVAEVERAEVTNLAQMAEQLVFNAIPGPEPVKRVIESVLDPEIQRLLAPVRAALPSLLKARGFGVAVIEHHGPPATPSPPPTATPRPSGLADAWTMLLFTPGSQPGLPPYLAGYSCSGLHGDWRFVMLPGAGPTPIEQRFDVSFRSGSSAGAVVDFDVTDSGGARIVSHYELTLVLNDGPPPTITVDGLRDTTVTEIETGTLIDHYHGRPNDLRAGEPNTLLNKTLEVALSAHPEWQTQFRTDAFNECHG